MNHTDFMMVAAIDVVEWLQTAWSLFQIILGFSAIIFVHELGHFGMAKWAGVRVDKFCIGFGREIIGFTHGETRYAFNMLPLGGYVKMLGQDDFEIDKSGEMRVKKDPRSFPNKPIGHRMLIVSGGVVMNIIFAALLFMVVFMVGREVAIGEIGFIKPDSPADVAGLQPGDVIKQIESQRINSFSEISMAIMLADPHESLDFHIERNGESMHIDVLPINNADTGTLMVGIGQALTARIVHAGPFSNEDAAHPRAGDTVYAYAGQVVTDANANRIMYRILSEAGDNQEIIVERPTDPENPDSPVERIRVKTTPRLKLARSDPKDPASPNVLGLRPLTRIVLVAEDSAAEQAGIRVGDIVLAWDGVDYPTGLDILESVARSGEIDLALRVRHDDGSEEDLTVRPTVEKRLLNEDGPPRIGAAYDAIADNFLMVAEPVATVYGRPTSAAQAQIPAGALIVAVDDQPVTVWHDLVQRFRKAAGGSVALQYVDRDGATHSVDFRVPHSIRTLLNLPRYSKIISVNGQSRIDIEINDRRQFASVNFHYALYQVLRKNVGKTVDIVYIDGLFGSKESAQLAVAEGMLDPWMGRISYDINILPAVATTTLQTSNPITAMGIGIQKTHYFILNVYSTIRRMIFSRTVGYENISGPLGIIKIGSDVAKQGFTNLLYLLAILSANLAVINFLPLPIVDGGLMVFLIIEKIKGAPVSLKTQAVTQVIGLALIGLMFVFVTYQDVLRIAGGP